MRWHAPSTSSTGGAVLGECHVSRNSTNGDLPGAIDVPRPIAANERRGKPPARARPPALDDDRPALDGRKALLGVKHCDDAGEAFHVRADERL